MHMQEEQILVAKELLQKGLSILDGKSHDYSQKGNAFSNFEFTGMILDFAELAGVEGTDLAFISLVSTKLARMIALRGRASENAQPKNETLVDTCIDIANYAALWGAYVVDCNHGLNVLPPLDTAAQSAQTPEKAPPADPMPPVQFDSIEDMSGREMDPENHVRRPTQPAVTLTSSKPVEGVIPVRVEETHLTGQRKGLLHKRD